MKHFSVLQKLTPALLAARFGGGAAGLLVLALLLPAVPTAAQVAQRAPAAPAVAGRPAPSVAARQQVLREALRLAPAEQLRPTETTPDPLGFVHEQYQVYYQGVKIEHGLVRVHSRGGRVAAVSGEARHPAAGLSVRPGLSEAAALRRALAAVGARSYKWQLPAEEAALRQQTGQPTATYRPQGELVLVGDFRQPEDRRALVLAWKFNIYAHEPVSREWLYVDAQTGQVVLRDAIIKHVNAPGASFATRYLGARTSITDNNGSVYRLRETATGKGVTTLNLRKSTTFSTAVDFVDNDNSWTAAEYNNANFDNAALDAHLGAQVTQDYWTTVHGRDSYDDRGSVLLSYVHYGNGTDNAFWNGTAMLYGDGSTSFTPLTSLDVCGHEVGHAVCETTADLIYSNESGALNEGFSDIWGCCIEHHLDPAKQIYLIGEDICKPAFGLALRSMSNPNQFGQPDTYKGTSWYTGTGDNGGVHYNSGVLNFWFYLLSAGGTGTNDFATAYNVASIGIAKAAKIAYRAERFYMSPSTNYNGARKATLQAAIDLYGLGSAEATAVAQAWRAVGVGTSTGSAEAAPTISSFVATSGLAGTVVTLTGTNLGATFRVQFNGVNATLATLGSGTSVAVTVPAGASTGLISLTTPSGTATTSALTPANFTISAPGPAPVIGSYAPAAGQAQGGAVTITGSNFTGATAVGFNGTAASFTVVSATSITCTVPAGATSGALTVTTPSGTATAPGGFMVLPAIASFAPASGAVGTAVTITGTSFTGALSVRFNGVYAASFTVTSATTITTTVPNGASTGPVTVRTPSGTATSAPFTVPPTLAFDSFSPTSGAVGAVVNMRGRGFTGTTAVRFGGVLAPTYTVGSDLELWATVPAGALSGNITLTTPLGTATSPLVFTVVVPGGPTITSFTPTVGPVGTAVTLTGTNFTGTTAVTFNGTAASFTVASATSILTTVPAGATTGPIGVATPVSTVFSATPFTLPPANDLCTGTLPVLTCGGSVTGSTLAATATGDPTATCGTNITAGAGGVFYTFVGTGGSVTLTTCNAATDYDTKLFVFTGACGAYTCVSGNDDGAATCAANGSSTPSTVTFASTSGTNYLVYVSGYNSSRGSFGLSATCAPALPTVAGLSPSAELPGMPVTITGTNFLAGAAVSFGGVAAGSVTVNSPTSLTAVVPASLAVGSSAVVVTTAAGPSASAPAFSVLGVYDGGSLGACAAAVPATATLADGAWHYLLSATGQVVLAYNYSGANLGTFAAEALRANPASPVRQDGAARPYLDRNWHLSASGGAFPGRSVQLRFYGLASELGRLQAAAPALTLATLNLTQYSGPNEDCDLGNNAPAGRRTLAAPASTPGGAPWFVAQTTVADHFSEFYLTPSAAPLPVELFSFSAEAQGAAVQLRWRTASERHSQRWDIERSPNGQEFVPIAQLPAQGSKASPTNYAYLDDKPAISPAHHLTVYYRLRQVDVDGTASYSPVRAVQLTTLPSHHLTISPNPARAGQVLLLNDLSVNASIELLDALGRRVAAATADAAGTAQLALPTRLAAGIYTLRSAGQARRVAVE